MNDLRQRPYFIALLALMLVFAACKGESPTAPPVGGPGPGTPPTGAAITLTAANPNPQTDSSTTITATVTVNGEPVPAGTAVEFGTTLGRFENTGTASALRVTNAQGQATVTLASTTAGVATVSAVVNNVVQRTNVTFTAAQQPPPQSPTAPTITSFNPTVGRVTGNELVTITGTNFREPVRVFFSVDGQLVPAQVVSVTPTQIQVLTPEIDLPAGQTLESQIVLFNEQGTPNEVRVTASTPFTFRRTQLTPQISGMSPPSGPLEGGTQTTIFGDGFEPFVQVFFGLAEAQIINVTFNSIVVVSPPSRDTTVDAQPAIGQVPLTVRNIQSGTETTIANGFRYHSAIQITAVGPTEGPFTGGTRVTIDGIGFDDPVAVTIGGVAAQPIQVTGTKIIAITGPVSIDSCADEVGAISVTNISTGASGIAEDLEFTYRVPQPIIISASSPVQPGGTLTVRVFGAFGFPRLRLDDRVLSITNEVDNGDGSTTFTAVVPTNVQLTQQTCTGASGVTAPQPTSFDVTYESATTGCNDTMNDGVVVEPLPTARMTLSPPSFTPFSATIAPGDPVIVGDETVTPSAVQTVNIVSNGAIPLDVTAITENNCAANNFTVSYPAAPFTLEQCEIAPITARYNGSTTPTTQSCTITITTNAGPARTVTLTGTSQ